MIRPFQESDLAAIKRMHEASGLPPNCMPDLTNPLFFVRLVNEVRGRVHAFASIKIVGEGFMLQDREQGTPQERWEELTALIPHTLAKASDLALEDVSCWVPPEKEPSFGKRLIDLGFKRSPWRSYSTNL